MEEQDIKNDDEKKELIEEASEIYGKSLPMAAAVYSPSRNQHHKNSDFSDAISDSYDAYDTDSAKDNLENDLPSADLQDL